MAYILQNTDTDTCIEHLRNYTLHIQIQNQSIRFREEIYMPKYWDCIFVDIYKK